MPRLRCLWVRSFSACRCHFWSSRQNTEMFVQSQEQDQKERWKTSFVSLRFSLQTCQAHTFGTFVSKFKSSTSVATAAQCNPTAMCTYAARTKRCEGPFSPGSTALNRIPIIYTSVHTLIYIVYANASMSLSVIHSESIGLWKAMLQVSWPYKVVSTPVSFRQPWCIATPKHVRVVFSGLPLAICSQLIADCTWEPWHLWIWHFMSCIIRCLVPSFLLSCDGQESAVQPPVSEKTVITRRTTSV